MRKTLSLPSKYPNFKLVGLALLIVFLIVYAYYVPPQNLFLVLPFILFLSIAIYIMTSFFLNIKIRQLTTLAVFLFFLINYWVGFQILNTILLVCFIIGLAILIK
ncbi:hypothetical protein A3F03_03305 [Candidatus Roizmanbacteria bacterium RIFCSPHIGHO2_12_FULL_41_11]|uniref:Uncharacterized protein n=3 Tax=Candidatus Roizmaniibacteriota TaxID=1752723 RepID=A0A1F7JR10_9BACT|nr:MAG: hypothetical protein A3F03_03305 [Candidatus Roizmanbacteria bacterium RIFCSPHIGHO2_12_FULL_41_11]OGK52765.1 MAG: hypothetical protein A2966_04630 [Candidatus Roizmanbacteria bacterium RIFCSPLOWO2_01_FULL_41_22]OGK58039.1 MAG: hypothetical protein A3H86_00830 [Candidatus Roizmanbacteria bacterium RIFCSPLOWO2_02_FULL_41_9]